MIDHSPVGQIVKYVLANPVTNQTKTHNLHANKSLFRNLQSMEFFLDMERADASAHKAAFFAKTSSNADTEAITVISRQA